MNLQVHEFLGDSRMSTDMIRGVQPRIELITFPGGEPHCKIRYPADIAGGEYLVSAYINSPDVLMAALVVKDALDRAGANSVTLYCPYLPGARQDRASSGTALTARLYSDLINYGAWARVYCVDPHSDVMPALVDNLVTVPMYEVFSPQMIDGCPNGYVIVCPDAGAAKKVEELGIFLAPRGCQGVYYGRKHRDMKTGALSGFSCDPIPDGVTAIICDDICDGGGTFLGLADATDLPKERLRLWTTHGIYSKGMMALHQQFELVGCTDAFPSLVVPDLMHSIFDFICTKITEEMAI